MSQTYRVRAREAVEETVEVGKKWKKKIRTLPVLPKERMHDIIADQFEQDPDWEKTEDGNLRKEIDENWSMELDPDSMQVEIEYKDEDTISLEKEEEMQVYDHGDNEERAKEKGKTQLKAKLQKEAEQQGAEWQERAKEQAKEQYESEIEQKVSQEIKEKVEKGNVEALKEKARSLGQVESESDQGNGEYQVKIRL